MFELSWTFLALKPPAFSVTLEARLKEAITQGVILGHHPLVRRLAPHAYAPGRSEFLSTLFSFLRFVHNCHSQALVVFAQSLGVFRARGDRVADNTPMTAKYSVSMRYLRAAIITLGLFIQST
jgi:hypothetical protein